MSSLRTKRSILLSLGLATAMAAPIQAGDVLVTATGDVTAVIGPGLTDPLLNQLSVGDSITFVYTVDSNGTPINNGFSYSVNPSVSGVEAAMQTVGAIPAPALNTLEIVDVTGAGADSIVGSMELPGQATARLQITSSSGSFLQGATIETYIGIGFVPFGSLSLDGEIIDSSTRVDVSFNIVGFTEFDGPIGMNYCMANPNNSGTTASITAMGTSCVDDNDVTLMASGLPAGNFGFFITSQTQAFFANPGGSEGNLCIGGNLGRYNQPAQIMQADAAGNMVLPIDVTQIPTPNGFTAAMAGDTWNFQAWYRDTAPAGPTSNFTDGVAILFN